MIKIPKRLSVNPAGMILPRPVRISLVIFLCLLFFISPYLLGRHKLIRLPFISLIYLLFFIACYVVYNRESEKRSYREVELEKAQEKKNSHDLKIKDTAAFNTSLYSKISSYDSLKVLAEKLGSSTQVNEVISNIVDTTYRIVGNNAGNCLLYLIDIKGQRPELVSSRKEGEGVIIKAKNGDIFDHWVLRHTSALLVEDTKKDFRFDMDKIAPEEKRGFTSLIAAPLISNSTMIGILRMDNLRGAIFSLHDLRLLRAIADLGAVAMEDAQLYERTLELAIRDGLTGLYLRRYLFEHLQAQVARGEGNIFSFVMIDIDHFKKYNDKYGHTAGDIVLEKIADALLQESRDRPFVVSRFGGEEFAVLLPQLAKGEAVEFAEGLRKKIASLEIELRRRPTKVTVSAGVAAFSDDARTSEGIINAADRALYRAKSGGRNKVCTA